MSKETKQDVFDEALHMLLWYTMRPLIGASSLRARYAAASDGDTEAQRTCPYCHDEEGHPCGPDGYYAYNLTAGSDGYIEDSDKIKYCQYCGRELCKEDDHGID